MGKTISIYLHEKELRWLDQLCKLWGVGRSEAFQMILQLSRKQSETTLLAVFENKEMTKKLKRMLRNSE